MHGAPGSSFGPRPLGGPRINLRTTRRRSLTSSNPLSWLVIPRNRLSLSVAALILTFLLYTFLFGGAGITQDGNRPTVYYNRKALRPHPEDQEGYEEPKLPDLVPADKVPDKLAEQFDLKDLPVLAPPHPNPKAVLARESVFTNPWPDAPRIASHWLSDERLNQYSGAAANWPTGRAQLASAPRAVPTIAWKDLYRPAGYQGPIGLKDLPQDQSAKDTPTIQADTFDESPDDVAIRRARQDWVRRAFRHAWGGYKSRAWGHDEVRPLTGKGNNPFNAWGATIIDSLSTLLLLNLTEEYSLARTHVRQVDYTVILGDKSVYSSIPDSRTVPVFETVIRYLGGLLSAYDLSGGDVLMLERAEELAQLLMGAFDTRYGLPLGRYQLGSKLDGKYAGRQALAEVGSFSLEFGRLAQITGKPEYYDVVHRAMSHLAHGWKSVRRWPGLLPSHPDDSKPDSLEGTYTLGALTDSYYEYLLKSSLLFRNSTAAEHYSSLYTEAIDSALSNGMIQKVGVVPEHDDLLLIGQLKYDMYIPILEHLACYAGGLLAMGSKLLSRPKDLETGDKFTQTCVWSYDATWTGVGPETLTFYGAMDPRRYHIRKDENGKTFLQVNGHPPGAEKGDRKSQGRPETIESVFYMWRITGDPVWQERGWRMFTNWVRYSISSFGFSGLNNVNSPRYRQVDSMESFVLAETLKYYYLLFSDPDFLSLDEFVFNTEAHPLQIPSMDSDTRPRSFTPSWQASNLDNDLRKIYDDYMDTTDGRGRGTWVQKYLSQGASASQEEV